MVILNTVIYCKHYIVQKLIILILEYIVTTFIIFLDFSIHCKTNNINQENKFKFIVTQFLLKFMILCTLKLKCSQQI